MKTGRRTHPRPLNLPATLNLIPWTSNCSSVDGPSKPTAVDGFASSAPPSANRSTSRRRRRIRTRTPEACRHTNMVVEPADAGNAPASPASPTASTASSKASANSKSAPPTPTNSSPGPTSKSTPAALTDEKASGKTATPTYADASTTSPSTTASPRRPSASPSSFSTLNTAPISWRRRLRLGNRHWSIVTGDL